MNRTIVNLEGKEYQIDIEKAKELGVLKEKDTRCKSWEEFKKKYQYNTCFYFDNNTDNIEKSCDPYNVNDQLTKEEAIAISAFSKLLKLRRDWIGTWNPDWSHLECKRKYCIICRNNNIIIGSFDDVQHTFSFPTEEMTSEFLKYFWDLFVLCKNLI